MVASGVINAIMEPQSPPIDVHIYLPPLAKLKPLIIRLQKISSKLSISANMDGKFQFTVKEQGVEVETKFENLTHPIISNFV